MGSSGVACVRAGVFTALIASSVSAQTVAQSFQELQEFLKPGAVVFVSDRTGQETWGRVEGMSASGLTLAVMEKSEDGFRTLTTSIKRTFLEDNVALILRSDPSGAKGAVIYPASWHKVQALQRDIPVTVVVEDGERRNYRFTSMAPDGLDLLTPSGQQETIETSRVKKVLRRGLDDPVDNGIGFGALAGAGTALAIVAIESARCGPNCNEPDNETALILTFTALGAGVGARRVGRRQGSQRHGSDLPGRTRTSVVCQRLAHLVGRP